MSHETIVNVDYKSRDGWHVFTSADLHGLYVASTDPRAAYDDVPVAIQALVEMDYSCRCVVSRALPFEEFAKNVLRGTDESSRAPELRSEALTVRGCRDDSVPGPN